MELVNIKNTQVQTKEVVMKVIYPVIFTDTETNILIEVPDLGIITEANPEGKAKGSLADAIAMARDAICAACITREDIQKEINNPSPIEMVDASKGIFAENGRSIVSMVDADITAYRKKLDNKSVRRNVTLPNWLNTEAEKAKINVSGVLQEALMKKIGILR